MRNRGEGSGLEAIDVTLQSELFMIDELGNLEKLYTHANENRRNYKLTTKP